MERGAPQYTMGLPLLTPDSNQGNSLLTRIWNRLEVGKPLTRRLLFQQQQNEENMRVELETKEEVQDMTKIREEATKLRATRRYNTKVQPRAFQLGDLIWWVQGEARKDPWAGKLGPNWESPFKVTKSLGNGAYKLQELDGKAIPRTWNATHLKFYFSWPKCKPNLVLFFLLRSFVPKIEKLGFWQRF